MDPFAGYDSFTDAIVEAAARAIIKAALAAGCIGLSLICCAMLVARARR